MFYNHTHTHTNYTHFLPLWALFIAVEFAFFRLERQRQRLSDTVAFFLSTFSYSFSFPLFHFYYSWFDFIRHTHTFYDLITLLDSGDRGNGEGDSNRNRLEKKNTAAKFVVRQWPFCRVVVRHCSVGGSCSKVYYYNVVCLMECKERNYCYCCLIWWLLNNKSNN